ncbi:MAG: c-type cytochrome [Rhodospirillaceae bacterium]|nr:c-type cytochrome [Rhodospirillales bacterium]
MRNVHFAWMALVLAMVSAPARAEPSTIDLSKWQVPDITKLADDHYGKLVRRGHALVTETYKYVGPEVADPSKRYAGNNLACQSCHLQAGTQPYSMPYVGVTSVFPQYRAREDDISTIEERVNGCMQRSMAGRSLPHDSEEMKAYVTYMSFLSQGIPAGSKLIGSGTKQVKEPARAANPTHGAQVYGEQCAVCHGEDGLGKRKGTAGDRQGYEFPPLWGADSYSQGAGMFRLLTAMQFAMHNMPLGTNYDAPQLSVDDAFDVMAFVNSQPRMAKVGMENDFPNRLRKPVDMPFPPFADGFSSAQHKYGPYDPIRAKMKELQDQAKAKK